MTLRLSDASDQVRVLGRGWRLARLPSGLSRLLDARRESRRLKGTPEGPVSRLVRRSHPGRPKSRGTGNPVKRTDLIKTITDLGCEFIRHGAKHDWYRN